MADALKDALRQAAGDTPANIALMHLLIACPDAARVEQALVEGITTAAAESATRLAAILDLLHAHPQAPDMVRAILADLDHTPKADGNDVAYWAMAFDRGAALNPEASVALYSLGSPKLLDAVTGEIVGDLQARGLIGPEVDCLDIGCGIGRIERALAPRLRSIVGIDISEVMVRTAQERTAALPNVTIRNGNGRDLGEFAASSFDLVLAVDSFPYIVESGLAALMLGEIARVLRPGGAAVIMNYSYRGDISRDRSEVAALGSICGLDLLDGTAPTFTLWDGVVFEICKR